MARLVTSVYTLDFSLLPESFDGFKIAQASDLHNDKGYGKTLERIKNEKPDIIVITGDMIHKEADYCNSLEFARRASDTAPLYYVNGNHESVLTCYKEFIQKLKDIKVKVLENETVSLIRGGNEIALIGISDPTFFKPPDGGVKKDAFRTELKKLAEENKGKFKVLLSHRPELMRDYFSNKIDLTLTGHAHGGQVRIPVIGPVYAPNQRFFPPLTQGVHFDKELYMVISRGLGKSNFVPRIFNPPEIVVSVLRKKAPEAGNNS